jgi:hypothetical protein
MVGPRQLATGKTMWPETPESAFSYQLSAISFQLSAFSYQLSAISFQSSVLALSDD